ncbi:uncharacterized protein LOC143856197 [Tasmannia lanceolata]|uniref:uncharacterized protein LOC143856197 n=1 Tax=Tasmannia lanceolata TaxID=3420 RepID=UPI0040647BF0
MGCISSKIATRSRSFREELSQSLQRRINGFPVFEDLIVSKNGTDQFFALLCTANTVTKKLQTATDSNPSIDPTNPETINTWELMADLEEEEQKEEEQAPRKEDGPKDVGLVRSRSFHTVEEYDEMAVSASNRWRNINVQIFEDSKSLLRESSSYSSPMSKVELGDMEVDATVIRDTKVVPEGSRSFQKPESSDPKSVEVSSYSCEPYKEESTCRNSIIENGSEREKSTNEKKGFRRKGPSALNIPVAVNFLPVGSKGEWGGGQEIFSGEYVTPRFGSFNGSFDTGGGAIFDPEMVAAFEEAHRRMIPHTNCGELEGK